MPTPVKYDTGGRGEGDNYHGLGWQARYVGDVTGPAGQYPKGFRPSDELQRVLDGDQPSGDGEPIVRQAKIWPTPVKNEQRAARYSIETSRRHFETGNHQVHLAQAARDPAMYPTPTASAGGKRVPPARVRLTASGRMESDTGTFRQIDLGQAAKAKDGRKIYPTPIKADSSVGKNLLTLQKVENGDGAFNMLAREVRKEEMVEAGTFVSDPTAVNGVTERSRRNWSTPTKTQPKMPTATLVRRMSDGIHDGQTSVPLVEVLQREELARVGGVKPSSQAEKGLWPTPMTTGLRGGSGAPKDLDERIGGSAQNGGGRTRGALPTPTSQNGLRSSSTSGNEHQPNKWQSPGHPEYGELNPDWVEWIMGWCIGWTSLEPLDPAAFEAWWQLQQADPETGLIGWWEHDPSDDPDSGITKTVKPPSKKADVIRQSRIAALGNGQVSAACAGGFVFLDNMDFPPTEEN